MSTYHITQSIETYSKKYEPNRKLLTFDELGCCCGTIKCNKYICKVNAYENYLDHELTYFEALEEHYSNMSLYPIGVKADAKGKGTWLDLVDLTERFPFVKKD